MSVESLAEVCKSLRRCQGASATPLVNNGHVGSAGIYRHIKHGMVMSSLVSGILQSDMISGFTELPWEDSRP